MCQKVALLHIPGKRNHYTFGPLSQLFSDRVPIRDLELIQQYSYVIISKNTRLAQPFVFEKPFISYLGNKARKGK